MKSKKAKKPRNRDYHYGKRASASIHCSLVSMGSGGEGE
jgi:hypothetical protein